MNFSKLLFSSIAFVALIFAETSTVAAFAPVSAPLDDTWFQVDISAKGPAVDTDDSSVSKESFITTAYMYVYEDSGNYVINIYSEPVQDDWHVTAGGSIPSLFITEDGIFMPMGAWAIYMPDTTAIVVYISGKFTVKVDKDDNLKKASFSTLGTVITDSSNPENKRLFANTKVKVKMIDADKLPFTPIP